ncbi:predicted protein [Nematostella vectensis]|uniref:Amidase domain-containing protein n=2 Tax=Nematostella vectensis TaxID=45351 RepID=A7SZS0_NEMVE|nr:predicted protein [Nematostella vectensis]|eukprot:XP_001622896.1 predicted protein [Nematostella vectensis]
MDPLLHLSATKLAKKIRELEVSSEEVIEIYIKRIREINTKINAVVDDCFREAIDEARDVDELLKNMGKDEREKMGKRKPLLGVPFTAKESFSAKGMPNCSGLMARKDFRAAEDAPVVERLRLAGAILIAVTNCSELCMWWESANRVYGRTCNPFDTARIAGGSSGGEGAVLGGAGSVIGIGADIGGSIRMPSFFNGVFGHKPSPDVVPNAGQFPNAEGQEVHFLCTGPMCRYAEDLLPLLQIMAGENGVKLKLDEEVDVSKLKFYSIEDGVGNFLVSKLDSELREAQRNVCSKLEEKLGVKVEVIMMGKFQYSLQIWARMMATSGGKPFCHYMGNEVEQVNPFWEFLKAIFGLSSHTLPAIGLGMLEKFESLVPQGTTQAYLQMAQELRQELQRILGENGVLIFPSHPTLALRHNMPMFYPFNFAYTGIFNVLYMPSTQCPAGLSKSGLPMGVQVVAANGQDHLTLAVAMVIEELVGGWDRLCASKQKI